jgi:hypothetical protein
MSKPWHRALVAKMDIADKGRERRTGMRMGESQISNFAREIVILVQRFKACVPQNTNDTLVTIF